MPDPMTAERAADPRADAAMSQLLASMQGRLRAFLGTLARVDVDDLVQETVTRAWRSRRTLDPERGSGEAWLLRIAFRAFLDHRAQRGRLAPHPHDDELVAGGRDPAQHAEIREHTAALLGQLPERERDVLLRFHRDGQSVAQIAAALRLPAGTVKSHLHRARNRLWALERARGDDA